MTRHGTLAYYLSAWIIGCPLVALLCWVATAKRVGFVTSGDLFEICFFALMVGVADALLFAFLLRRLMHWINTRSVVLWTVAGAILAVSLISLFAQAWYRLHDGSQGAASFAVTFLFAGPGAIWNVGWWQAPIEGAAIGAVLGLIDRAFNPVVSSAAEPSGQPTTASTS